MPLDFKTVDVLGDRGHMSYSHATGEAACTAAIEYCLEVSEQRGEPPPPVVDFFCGYGSVLAVANAYGVDAYGMDVSLKCCRKSATHRASEALVQGLATQRDRNDTPVAGGGS